MKKLDYGQFRQPHTLDEAHDRLLLLSSDLDDIAAQLDDPTRRADKSDDQYQRWRKKARNAMTFKKAESRYIRNWIEQNRSRGAVNLLKRVVPILDRASSNGILMKEETLLLEEIKIHLDLVIPAPHGLLTGSVRESAYAEH